MGNCQNNPIGEYVYDGEGYRDKKIAGTELIVFVYNAGGQFVADFSKIAIVQADPVFPH